MAGDSAPIVTEASEGEIPSDGAGEGLPITFSLGN